MRRAAVAAAVVALLAAPAAAQAVPHDFYGVVLDGKLRDAATPSRRAEEWQRMKSSGVESVRTGFDWSAAQPTRASDVSFARSDALVALAARRGIDLLPVVFSPPGWASRDGRPNGPPSDPSDYADYLVALVTRYGPGGTFWAGHRDLPAHPIRAWQIWNEPNLRHYWNVPKGEDWAAGYGRLLRVAHNAIKRADPGARIVLAGLANDSWSAMGALYEYGGAKGEFDVAAVHPYTAQPHGPLEIVRRFRAAMADRGDRGKPLWVTELGLPASKGKVGADFPLQTTPAGMARFLTTSYADLTAGRADPATRVDRVYWYTWGSSYHGGDPFAYSGLVHFADKQDRVSGTAALAAYRTIARR